MRNPVRYPTAATSHDRNKVHCTRTSAIMFGAISRHKSRHAFTYGGSLIIQLGRATDRLS